MDASAGVPTAPSAAASSLQKFSLKRRKSRVLMQKVLKKRGTADKGELQLKRFLTRKESKRMVTSSSGSTALSKTGTTQITRAMREAKKIRDNLSIHRLREQDITSLSLRIAAASLSRSCALPSAHTVLNMISERSSFDLKKDKQIMELYKQDHVEEFFRTTDYGYFLTFAAHYTHFLQHYMSVIEPNKTKDLRKVKHLAKTHALKAMAHHGAGEASAPPPSASSFAPAATDAPSAASLEHWYGEMDMVPGTKRVVASRKQRNHWEWPTVLGQSITRGKADLASGIVIKQPSIQPDPTGKAFWVREIGAGHGDRALQFNAPTGIDVTIQGLEEGVGAIARIAIADTGNHRVQIATLHARSELQRSAAGSPLTSANSSAVSSSSSSTPTIATAASTTNKDGPGKELNGRQNEVYLFEGLLGLDSLFSGKIGSLEAPTAAAANSPSKTARTKDAPDHFADPRLKSTEGRRIGQFTSPRMVSFCQRMAKDGSKHGCVHVSDNALSTLMGHPRIQEFHISSHREHDTPATFSGFIDNCSYPKMSLERALVNPVHGVTVAGSTHFVFTDCCGRPTCPPKRDRLFVSVEKQKLLDSLTMEADASHIKAKELKIKAEVRGRWKRRRYLHPADWRKLEEADLKRELEKLKQDIARQKLAEEEASMQEAALKSAEVEEEMSKHSFRIREVDSKISSATNKKFGSLEHQRKDYKTASTAVMQRDSGAAHARDSESDSDSAATYHHDGVSSLDGDDDHSEFDDKKVGGGANYDRLRHKKHHQKVPDMVTGFAWTFPRAARPLDIEMSMLSCLGTDSHTARSVRRQVQGWFDVLNRDNDYASAVYTSRTDRVNSLGHDRWKKDFALAVEIDQCMINMMPSLLKMVLSEDDFKKYIKNLTKYKLAGDLPEDALNKTKSKQRLRKEEKESRKSMLSGRGIDSNAQNSLAKSFYVSHPLRIEWYGILQNLREDISAALNREDLPAEHQKEIDQMARSISTLPAFRMPSDETYSAIPKELRKSKKTPVEASENSKHVAEGGRGLFRNFSKKFSMGSVSSSSFQTLVRKASNLGRGMESPEEPGRAKQKREDARRDWNLEVQHKLVKLACLARLVRDAEAIAEIKQSIRKKRQRVDKAKAQIASSKALTALEHVGVGGAEKDGESEDYKSQDSDQDQDQEQKHEASGGETKSSIVRKNKNLSVLMSGGTQRRKSGVVKGNISTRNLPGVAASEFNNSHTPVDKALRSIYWHKTEGKVKEMISEIVFERFNNYLRVYDQLEDTYLFQTSDERFRQAAEQPMSVGITTADMAIAAQIKKYDESGWQIRRDVIKRGKKDSVPLSSAHRHKNLSSSGGEKSSTSSSASSTSKNKEGWWNQQKQGVDTFTLVEVPRSSIRGKSMQAYITPNPCDVGMWVDGTVVGLDRERGLYVFEHQNDACCEFMDKLQKARERDRKQKEMDTVVGQGSERPSSPAPSTKSGAPVAAESASNAGDGAVTGTFSVSNKSKRRILLVARTHLREKPPIARGLFSKPWGTAQTQSNDNQFLVVSDYELGCVHFFDMLLVNTEDEALINNTNLDGASGRSAVAEGGPGGHGASGAAEVEENDRGGRPSPPSKMSTFDVESGADNVKQQERKSPYLYTVGTMGKQRGQLRGPKGMCFDPANRLIIADSLNNRIQCFEYVPRARGGAVDVSLHPSIGNHQGNGRWECCFTYPENPGKFGSSDRGNKNNQEEEEDTYAKFAGHSAAISHVDNATHDQPSLHHPSDVCVDAFGNILVADTGNQCIRILRTRMYYGPHYPVEPALVDSSEAWMFEKTLKGQYVRTWPYTYVECIATWGCRGFLEGQLVEPVAICTYSVPTEYASQTFRGRTTENDEPGVKLGTGEGGRRQSGGKKSSQKNSKRPKKSRHKHDAAVHSDATETKVVEFWEQRYLIVDKGKHCVTEFSVTPPDFVWNASKVLENSSARDFAQPNLGNFGLPGTARRRMIEARNAAMKKSKRGKKR